MVRSLGRPSLGGQVLHCSSGGQVPHGSLTGPSSSGGQVPYSSLTGPSSGGQVPQWSSPLQVVRSLRSPSSGGQVLHWSSGGQVPHWSLTGPSSSGGQVPRVPLLRWSGPSLVGTITCWLEGVGRVQSDDKTLDMDGAVLSLSSSIRLESACRIRLLATEG